MTDWIEWNGGECPVGAGVRVDIKFRDGRDICNIHADLLRWNTARGDLQEPGNDIVAYRPVDAPGASTDGWIEWFGSVASPVDKGAVRVRWRDGDEGEDLASALDWVHRGRGGDIVAYRLLDTPKPPASALTRQPSGTHYSDAAIQPVQFIEANKLGFLEGCIVKRATRHNHPTGKGREDIEKIIHEAQLLLELRYGAV